MDGDFYWLLGYLKDRILDESCPDCFRNFYIDKMVELLCRAPKDFILPAFVKAVPQEHE